MSDPVDQEVDAIRHVLAALTPLSEKARASVLEYVSKRLSAEPLGRTEAYPRAVPVPAAKEVELPSGSGFQVHIKVLKEEKKPWSANEMAALVGYYLSSVAPPGQRKSTISRKDVETYFKIAEFPLPKQIQFTLANSKTAGYFDAVGDGEYKLNAVGHNLVVHSMPRGASKSPGTTKRASKRGGLPKRNENSRGRGWRS